MNVSLLGQLVGENLDLSARGVVERAQHGHLVLMDASKVNGRGMYRFAELADVDSIVMDRDPEGAVAASIAEIADATRPALIIATA